MMRTVYKDADRFAKTYFDAFKGYYFTGDGESFVIMYMSQVPAVTTTATTG